MQFGNGDDHPANNWAPRVCFCCNSSNEILRTCAQLSYRSAGDGTAYCKHTQCEHELSAILSKEAIWHCCIQHTSCNRNSETYQLDQVDAQRACNSDTIHVDERSWTCT